MRRSTPVAPCAVADEWPRRQHSGRLLAAPSQGPDLHSGPLIPAEPSFTSGGTLFSERYGDVYFSAAGGIEETRHVFLHGNDLSARWRDRARFTIVETGFGSGLNFLAAWQAFRAEAPASARLHFVSVEKHPFRGRDLATIHAAWPQLAALSRELIAEYPPLVPGFHRLHFEGGRVSLTLLFGEAAGLLGELDACADAFFLDGFAPAKNPDMWTEALCGQLARIAAPDATAATWSVAGSVREALAAAGFTVEKRPGFGHKREMLVARCAWRERPEPAAARSAIVVGAGIAGASCALALARRGIDVTLIDAGAAAASAASANPAGVVRPFPTLEQGGRSRFTWAAYFYACRHYASTLADPASHARTGVLQLARDPAQEEKLRRALMEFGVGPEVARPVGEQEGARLCGAAIAGPGVWYEGAGWVAGPAAARATLHAAGGRLTTLWNTEAAAIRSEEGIVEAIDAHGRVLAGADAVILANGHRAAALAAARALRLRPVRGQVSFIPAAAHLRAIVCREGYVTPAIGGAHVVGATFDERNVDEAPRREDHLANLARAERMLPGMFREAKPEDLAAWVGLRCVSRDRRPLLGEIEPRIHGCLALGSRGFTWAPLAAELVASRLAGDPLPIERGVAAELSPARFAGDQPQ
ncbi:MAG TPA: bifunctional tRNA (5-methylaminomethyl-2-thiouridine)(34)-methyltransferase MnmD/FAD-dependent 5-carboxymethylaminomethyl-2-thiouridine(34) oxidoreductase MnmC [Burkholderiales bacterium]|nr:bifunctional tRNA (5-methylaminomethyl-2-thiouridine)(34)-methyltransferase MnmD/FAD-dependent 5-carboxymethylaminomethyl-2-thiouridine(34) oxidoreductase MnmC [Burkholderiales bacterium]